MKQKSVQDVDVLGHFRKTNIRYCQKIAHGMRGETFSPGTPNKATEAAKSSRQLPVINGERSGWSGSEHHVNA